MRPLMMTVIGLLAAALTSLTLWVVVDSQQPAWCEVVEAGLLRTNATQGEVSEAITDVMRAVRRPAATPVETLSECEYTEHASAWFKRSGVFGYSSERLASLDREQRGADGERLQVKTLSGPEMPTLIFVEHDNRGSCLALTEQIAERLGEQGVAVR